MRILIAGGRGFIGQRLISNWKGQHEITVIGRTANAVSSQDAQVRYITWEQLSQISPQNIDVVINLAGETINHLRWTKSIQHKILQSRISATQKLVAWALNEINPHLHFCNASALSIYGLYSQIPSIINNENMPIKKQLPLLCQVAQQWEACLQPLIENNIATSMLRFAVVLDPTAGAFPQLLNPARFGLAAKMGSGQQPFSWVSITDVVRAIDWIIAKKITGPCNIVAPQLLTQDQWTAKLCEHLHRPYWIKMPDFLVKIVLGQMGQELLLQGPIASAQLLTDSEFSFTHPTLIDFLKNFIKQP